MCKEAGKGGLTHRVDGAYHVLVHTRPLSTTVVEYRVRVVNLDAKGRGLDASKQRAHTMHLWGLREGLLTSSVMPLRICGPL